MREKTYSQTPYGRFKIENIKNGNCTVLFFDNIVQKQDEEKNISYEYDLYKIELAYRENLQESITRNYDKWLAFAKDSDYEKVATEVRKKRDRLLSETDWTQAVDSALSEKKKVEFQEYRQNLRDITGNKDFPYNLKFPIMPNPNNSEENFEEIEKEEIKIWEN